MAREAVMLRQTVTLEIYVKPNLSLNQTMGSRLNIPAIGSAGRLRSVAEILFFALASSWAERYMVLMQWTSSDWKNTRDARCFFYAIASAITGNICNQNPQAFSG